MPETPITLQPADPPVRLPPSEMQKAYEDKVAKYYSELERISREYAAHVESKDTHIAALMKQTEMMEALQMRVNELMYENDSLRNSLDKRDAQIEEMLNLMGGNPGLLSARNDFLRRRLLEQRAQIDAELRGLQQAQGSEQQVVPGTDNSDKGG